jgi:hypothetical protein
MGELLLKGNLKPNKRRAIIAISFVWIVLAIDILWIILDGVMIVSNELTSLNETLHGLLENVSNIVILISVITFIQWFRRAYYNLHTKVNDLTYSEGWAIGCWFLPIINLYRPYKIMKELYDETENLLTERIDNYIIRPRISLIEWWWLLYIIYFVILIFSVNDSVITILSLIETIIMIPLALITIKLIKDYSTFELLLYDLEDENLHGINSLNTQ